MAFFRSISTTALSKSTEQVVDMRNETGLGLGLGLWHSAEVSLPFLLLQFFAEFIFCLVKDKFTELAGGRWSAPNSRHKVLAGIVMTRGEKERRRRTLSLLIFA